MPGARHLAVLCCDIRDSRTRGTELLARGPLGLQNVFTFAKTAALLGLIAFGISLGLDREAVGRLVPNLSIHARAWHARLGAVLQGRLPPGALDRDGLLKLMNRGLLVTELLGHGINYVTGDYSRGAAGFWIEDGRIAYPVEEITIAGNLKAMLAGIVAVGNDVQVRGTKQTGSILIDRMTIAGE